MLWRWVLGGLDEDYKIELGWKCGWKTEKEMVLRGKLVLQCRYMKVGKVVEVGFLNHQKRFLLIYPGQELRILYPKSTRTQLILSIHVKKIWKGIFHILTNGY